jgi:hypothetical protein
LTGRGDGRSGAQIGSWQASTALLALLALLAWFSTAAASARKPAHRQHKSAHVVRCKPGQAKLTVGERVSCVSNALHGTTATTNAVDTATVLGFGVGHARDRRGRHAPSFAKLARRAGSHTLQKVEAAIAVGLARAEALELGGAIAAHTARAPVASAATAKCSDADEIARQLKEYEEAPPEEKAKAQKTLEEAQGGSSRDGELDASLDLANGAAKLGINIKDKGIRIEIGLRSCGGDDSLELDACPTAQGTLEGHDRREFTASIKVTEGSKLLLIQDVKLTGETTIKAQTGDDAKLDHFDIKHVYTFLGTVGDAKQGFGPITVDTTYIGEARIDMRSPTTSLPPAVVDVMASGSGIDPDTRIAEEIKLAHDAQAEADKEFAAEVKKATEKLREHEEHWLEPNKCAQMKFEPGSETLTLQKGQTGSFKSRTEASGGGAPPTATWKLGDQQNASFTPAGGEGNPLSTSYSVTNAGKGIVVSSVVKATSKAGVAEATWKQKTGSVIQTITGSFSGTDTRGGERFEWSGTATFARVPESPDGTSVLETVASEVTITASGVAPEGCTQSGKEQVPVFGQSVFSVLGEAKPGVQYDIDVPFGFPGLMNVVLSACPPKVEGGSRTTSLPGQALLTGNFFAGGASALVQTSPDGVTFEGSATGPGTEPGEKLSWSWSFTGST